MPTNIALKTDGSVWTWGSNTFSAIGDGNATSVAKTAPVRIGTGFTAIAAGDNHLMALKADGSVWDWGSNLLSALGNASIRESLVPAKITLP